MTDRYAVFGNPVGHSLSPRIHALFAAQCGEDLSYAAILAPLDDFAGALHAFIAAGGRGANVTVPFKEEAYRLAGAHTPRAEAAGAVNTLRFDSEGILGDNTDGVGLVRDLTGRLGLTLEGRRILIFGAGGATRGVILPLLEQRPATLTIANRTAEKARQLAARFAAQGEIVGGGLELAQACPFDLVINATSTGLAGGVLPAPSFAADALAYDMVYGRATPFLASAQAAGVRCADGLGMLVEQAAEAFRLWRGILPQTAPVLAALHASRPA